MLITLKLHLHLRAIVYKKNPHKANMKDYLTNPPFDHNAFVKISQKANKSMFHLDQSCSVHSLHSKRLYKMKPLKKSTIRNL